MPDGILRQANLQMLFERAKQYETASFKGLYNFISFIEKLRLSSNDMSSAKIIGENDNVIRIMSIHKSKGLEFPVVFLSGTGKQFNLMDLNKNLLLHQELGIGVKYINYEKQVQYDTLSKQAVREKSFQEIISEEMRILYVALTRAKEKLIITGIKKEYEKQLEKLKSQIDRYNKQENKINPILIKKHAKFIDWILLAYFYDTEKMKEFTYLNVYDKKQVLEMCEENEPEEIINQESTENKEKIHNQFRYKYELSTKIPTNASVTQLKNGEEKLVIDFEPPKFTKHEKDTKLTGAQKGTLLHLCLQKLDISKQYNLDSIKYFINELVKKEIITDIEAENIDYRAILDFTNSNIWREIKQAKEVNREKPFYIAIPAKEIYDEDVAETILVQGIIDLYFVNNLNELVLVDYKTDFVHSESDLINKYKGQLGLYKRALESALGKEVKYVYIYSTCLKKEIMV